jgi:hypothetical protein
VSCVCRHNTTSRADTLRVLTRQATSLPDRCQSSLTGLLLCKAIAESSRNGLSLRLCRVVTFGRFQSSSASNLSGVQSTGQRVERKLREKAATTDTRVSISRQRVKFAVRRARPIQDRGLAAPQVSSSRRLIGKPLKARRPRRLGRFAEVRVPRAHRRPWDRAEALLVDWSAVYDRAAERAVLYPLQDTAHFPESVLLRQQQSPVRVRLHDHFSGRTVGDGLPVNPMRRQPKAPGEGVD